MRRRRTLQLIATTACLPHAVCRTVFAEKVVITTPEQFGAVGDGVADDSWAIQQAIARGHVVQFSSANYSVWQTIIISKPTVLVGAGVDKTEIVGQFDKIGKILFDICSDYFVARDISISGSIANGELNDNIYAFNCGSGGVAVKDHIFDNVRVRSFLPLESLEALYGSPPFAAHAIYCENVDGVIIEECEFADITGSGLFFKNTSNVQISNCLFIRNRWYSVNFEENVELFYLVKCNFIQDFGEGVYWGGIINIASQVGKRRCRHGVIRGNSLSGFVSYGSVIRVQSADNISICKNVMHGIGLGSRRPTQSGAISGIRVQTRGIDEDNQNGPCQRIKISDNVLEAPQSSTLLTLKIGIYCDNQYQIAREPLRELLIAGNNVVSGLDDPQDRWSGAISLHGQSGGIERVNIEENQCEGEIVENPPVRGIIGLDSNDEQGSVSDVVLRNNRVSVLEAVNKIVGPEIYVGKFVSGVRRS